MAPTARRVQIKKDPPHFCVRCSSDEVPVKNKRSPSSPQTFRPPEQVRITPTTMSRKTGWSVPYCSMMLTGARKVPLKRAIIIYELTGAKMGPLSDSSDAEIAALCRHLRGIGQDQRDRMD
jgi:hypothetical protein